jgi:hypothetical protein
MFAVFCPYQEARVLLAPGNILDMERRTDGVAIHYRCWCGHEGVHVITRTGRPATAVRADADAPAPAAAPVTVPTPARVASPAIPASC